MDGEQSENVEKAPLHMLLYLHRPMASKIQVRAFQLGEPHVHVIPSFLVTV